MAQFRDRPFEALFEKRGKLKELLVRNVANGTKWPGIAVNPGLRLDFD
jgi:hypothetical protein